MPGVRIVRFAGLLPEVSPKLLREDHAQMAHNCLLWDGWLRALPNWIQVATAGGTVQSIFPIADTTIANQYDFSTVLLDAQLAAMEPLVPRSLWGIYTADGSLRYFNPYNSGGNPHKIMDAPAVGSPSQTITPQHLSIYPVQRTYAITFMAGNMESAPLAFPVIGVGTSSQLFEGDFVTLNFTIGNIDPTWGITGVRLYRTVVGFDTGENLENPRETTFHLVAELSGSGPSYSFVDTLTSDNLPGDRCLTETFGPMLVDQPVVVAQTDSGWLVCVGHDATFTNRSGIHVSERFLWHAWPLANYSAIPDIVTDAVVFYDDIFIGTKTKPWHVRIVQNQNSEVDTLEIHTRYFPDVYACVPGTMVTTNFGAMYASPDGLVALEVNEDQISTKRVTNPGDTLINPSTTIRIGDTLNAAWWNGLYIGFCTSQIGYIFCHENNHNNYFPLAQLVTFNPPPGIQGPSLVVGKDSGGLLAAFGNVIYRWPLPGYGYESSTKQIYHWKSKVFTMAGGTCFAAAKVVNANDGGITFNFYGDGVLIYSHVVTDSQPFRIPCQHSVIDVEIELIGQGTVKEVHIATSMRELTETTGIDYA